MNLQEFDIDPRKVPAHVAVIMDGNGRWAKARGLDRSEGHIEGVNTVRKITEIASEAGVKYLTLYTFSTENWNRPQAEVDALMTLVGVAITRETPDLIKNNVRLTIMGDIERMPQVTIDMLRQCMADTAHCTGLVLNLAISYSSRWEITEAARRIAAEVAAGKLDPADITDRTVADHMASPSIPDPDLLIRTGGDYRVSNYLLWQIAYSELYFTDLFWPDFSKSDFLEAIRAYQQRQRRFGRTGDQVKSTQQSES
ncbi:MAG: isoprenyl transferase [Muribaculaceae bacterium]|nr:isoprenyl transferase [Muribaculaceae bacterium]MDE5958822.1 isoprenyl transferase [Muribaculaceae bacterium]MDE6462907.1 isoprenyl transferase [Muribaculaceae bacterium]MDE6509854.1 isoprenyl transferase [Muribaculaceae bacterium]MDE7144026.1 isoprenyl transferase [Muribaculaceae bacterium]